MSLESRSDLPVSLETLVRQIEALDEKTKQELLRQLERSTKPVDPAPEFQITDLRGAGRGVYADADAEETTRIEQIDSGLRRERDSWER